MTSSDLKKHIDSKSFLPVYLFHGEEDFLMSRQVKALAKAALADGDPSFNYNVFWGSESETKAAHVVSVANEFPVMAQKRVVVVHDADKIANEEPFPSYLKHPSPDTVLILEAGAITAKRKTAPKQKQSFHFLSYLEESAENAVLEFKPLKDAALAKWIETEFARQGKRIDDRACIALVDLKGTSTRELAGEIDKLATALPDKTSIEMDDILEYLGSSRQYNIFELVNAVLERSAPRAQEIGQRILERESAVGIVALLYRQMNLLWKLRSVRNRSRMTDEEARKLGFAGKWQAEMHGKHLGKFGDDVYFERCFEYLLEADLEMKSRPTDRYPIILARLLHQLTAE